jgi:Flp pilus assembly pilin Flp
MPKLSLLARREDGQTMAEYGVVLAVITVAIVGVLGLLSGAIQSAISTVISAI